MHRRVAFAYDNSFVKNFTSAVIFNFVTTSIDIIQPFQLFWKKDHSSNFRPWLLTSCSRHLSVSASSSPPRQRRDGTEKTVHTFTTLNVERPRDGVLHVQLNRPDRLNAMNGDSWREIAECFDTIAEDSDCRSVILSGLGKHFCSGLDLTDMSAFFGLIQSDLDVARKAFKFRSVIRAYQNSFSAIERCPKPVITVVHGGCIGAGVDMTSACDIRYCTSDAFFSIKEVDIGLAADVGTLQRFPKIVGNDSLVRELAFTARKFYSTEAKDIGFVSRVFSDRTTMIESALNVAEQIAKKSPVAVQGTKHNLNYSRDHPVQEGLDYMVNWQMSMLQSEDLMKAAMASADRSGKTVPEFSDV